MVDMIALFQQIGKDRDNEAVEKTFLKLRKTKGQVSSAVSLRNRLVFQFPIISYNVAEETHL